MDAVSLVIALLCAAFLLVLGTVALTRRYDHRQILTSDGRHVVLVRLSRDDWQLTYALPAGPRMVVHYAEAIDAHRGYLEALAGLDPTISDRAAGACWEHLWGSTVRNPFVGNLVLNVTTGTPAQAAVRLRREAQLGLTVTKPTDFIRPGS